MAFIRSRQRRDGSMAHQVLWTLGGVRGGRQESETFDSEEGATDFRALVDAAGQQWPAGWVKGRGFVVADGQTEAVAFRDWAEKYIRLRTGIQEDTRESYQRLVDNHMLTKFGNLDVRDPNGITPDLISEWVLTLQRGRKPKTVHNVHGLLYAIMQAAVEHEPPLRASNPCAKTRLPRVDDYGDDWDGEHDDEMVFLTGPEFRMLHSRIKEDARDLVELLVGTGLRWGEVAALQVRDIDLLAATPTLRVARAWKHKQGGGRRLGPPKTKASRRTLALSPGQVDMLLSHVAGRRKMEFVFEGPSGGAWPYTTFRYRRWEPAIRATVRCEEHRGEDRKSVAPCGCPGTLEKGPRIHDLRHTHVSWLIAANVPVTAIQRRLGHESIVTTSDRYGHLAPELHGQMAAVVDATLTIPVVDLDSAESPVS